MRDIMKAAAWNVQIVWGGWSNMAVLPDHKNGLAPMVWTWGKATSQQEANLVVASGGRETENGGGKKGGKKKGRKRE